MFLSKLTGISHNTTGSTADNVVYSDNSAYKKIWDGCGFEYFRFIRRNKFLTKQREIRMWKHVKNWIGEAVAFLFVVFIFPAILLWTKALCVTVEREAIIGIVFYCVFVLEPVFKRYISTGLFAAFDLLTRNVKQIRYLWSPSKEITSDGPGAMKISVFCENMYIPIPSLLLIKTGIIIKNP